MLKKMNLPQRFLNELIAYCLADKRIVKVLLFGSRAFGDFRETSDIDLAIYTRETTHTEQNLIEMRIQEIPTYLKIDIVFIERLKNEGLLSNILREGVVLYEKGENLREVRGL